MGLFSRLAAAAFGLSSKIKLVVICLAIAALCFFLAIHQAKRQAQDELLEQIGQQNTEAASDADAAARRVDDCLAIGGVWGQRTGNCRR